MKLAIICQPGFENFLADLEQIIQHSNLITEVRTCYSYDSEAIRAAINWSDIVWIEFGNQLAIELTNTIGLLIGKKVVCRVHSYEVFSGFFEQINWWVVDDLVFVAQHVKDYALDLIPHIERAVKNIHVIPNGVDTKFFNLNPQSYLTNSIAFVGYLNSKKGLMLLAQAFESLWQTDNRLTLRIAGKWQDTRMRIYLTHIWKEMGIEEAITHDGWLSQLDLGKWLTKSSHILCTSPLESQHISVMQGMLCGLKPLIHNFPGAKDIYRHQDIWNTIPDLEEMVFNHSIQPSIHRAFVKENYGLYRFYCRIGLVFGRIAEEEKKSYV